MWVLINWDMWWCIGSSACPVKGESEFEQQNWTLNKIKHWTSSQLISLWFRLLGGHCIMTSLSRVGGSHENVMEVGGLSWNTWIKYICSMNFPICSQTNQSHICCWEKMNTALPMFHLRCARLHTFYETSAHNKTWSANKCFFKKCFCTCLSYISFYIQIYSGKMLHKGNFMRTQTLKNSREHWADLFWNSLRRIASLRHQQKFK